MINPSSKFARLPAIGGLSLCLVLLFAFPGSGMAADKQTLHGHVPEAVRRLNLKPLGRPAGSTPMHLVIGLPLHNQDALTNLLTQLYDPASTNFHHYLVPAQFTERFGPTEADYQRVIQFAKTNRLDIGRTYGDRVLLEVSAPVSSIESAFHVTMQTYQHPTEARQFFAPDVEPSVDADVPILYISGLNNFSIPRPLGHPKRTTANGGPGVTANGGGGSAPDGNSFIGNDFRKAYVPGVTLTGTGQSVGLVEFEGFFQSDITAYISTAGISVAHPAVVEARQPGFTGPTASDTNGVGECSLDIETVMSMAPGLSSVVVFEESTVSNFYTGLGPIFAAMASSNQIQQFSTSWDTGPFNPPAEVYLMQMASQGQSFCAASGDTGAYVGSGGDTIWPDDDPYVTSVGGTELTMSGGSYVSESVFYTDFKISEGGVSGQFSIPLWQQGVNMSAVGGSTTMRNFPDVAMCGDNFWNNYDHTTSQATGFAWQGTSFSAPLWAGFTALVNQQFKASALAPIGFMNPALYAIGEGSSYSACFNDITTGSNTNKDDRTQFFAAPGYDLCTGWGSAKGAGLIFELTGYAGNANLVFVDFNYSGSTQNGLYNTPFKTLAGGTNKVIAGGTIIFNGGGSSTETMKISKPMVLNAINGTAIIGTGH